MAACRHLFPTPARPWHSVCYAVPEEIENPSRLHNDVQLVIARRSRGWASGAALYSGEKEEQR